MEAARVDNYYSRCFTNRLDPEKVVNVTIFSGHPRDVAIHTPDQCYVLSGFKEEEEQNRYIVETGKGEADFWTNRFRKGSSFEGTMDQRLFWSFSNDGEWQAPDQPEVFADQHPRFVQDIRHYHGGRQFANAAGGQCRGALFCANSCRW